MNQKPDWNDLKDYASYGYDGQEPDISLQQYALTKLTPDLLVATSKLFFPEFVTHEQGVFLADRFSESLYKNWKRGKYKHDIPAIERIINHVHLGEDLRNGFQQL